MTKTEAMAVAEAIVVAGLDVEQTRLICLALNNSSFEWKWEVDRLTHKLDRDEYVIMIKADLSYPRVKFREPKGKP